MPLFSDHISNMYYSGSSPYNSAPYSYNSLASPLGTSYSASYLSPGGSYSNHSSLGGYGRAPLTSRWITGVGRNYSPMLSTISERTTSSPIRVNSPRRIPITTRSYASSAYSSRPININTSDIDVSKDKYRPKVVKPIKKDPIIRKDSSNKNKENSPFTPRVDGKPETGIDSSPGSERSTIKRGRTVVRLHTIKRKERDSPRKPIGSVEPQEAKSQSGKSTDEKPNSSQESLSWRERLSEDLVYKDKKEKKTLGTKLVEKFTLKEVNNTALTEHFTEDTCKENDTLLVAQLPGASKSPDRRCSVELLAEQSKLLDSLIRRENLSTATLDISKVGDDKTKTQTRDIGKIRKSIDHQLPIKTTKSDHSLHNTIKSVLQFNDEINNSMSKRRSVKKSRSGGHIFRLDSITELPKGSITVDLPPIKEINKDNKQEKLKRKLKTKITSSVEVSTPLKFKIGNVEVEEKPRSPKKEITFSSEIDEPIVEVVYQSNKTDQMSNILANKQSNDGMTTNAEINNQSPEPEDGNFWVKIGKRETIYLKNRKQVIETAKENYKRDIFWFPEDGNEEAKTDNLTYNDRDNINKDEISNTPALHLIKHHMEEKKLTDFDITCKKLQISDLQNNILNAEHLTEPRVNLSQLRKEPECSSILNDQNLYLNEADPCKKISVKASKEKTQDQIIEEPSTFKSIDNYIIDEKINTNIENSQSLSSDKLENKQGVANSTSEKDLENQQISDKINNADELKNSNGKVKKKKSKVVLKQEKNISEPKLKIIDTPNTNNIQINESNIQQNNNSAQPSFGICDNTGHGSQHVTIEFNIDEISLHSSTESMLSSATTITSHDLNNKCTETNNILQDTAIEDSSFAIDCVNINSLNYATSDNIPLKHVEVEFKNIPIKENEIKEVILNMQNIGKSNSISETNVKITESLPQKEEFQVPGATAPTKPVKNQAALRPLIATPRPLQKKPPQVIHSRNSSDSSSEEETSDDDEDSDTSKGSEEFYECEANLDGRTSTGSNDSGFDSSAPASPAGFLQIKKDCDVNCHRKCEKLTANLCGVNQRLLVEALATRTTSKKGAGENPGPSSGTSVPVQNCSTDILEQELEHSTAYGLFRKTGRFTPPARSIPRFKKYTIDDFHFLKVLGKGSFGKVLLAELKNTEYYYAVKCLKKDVVLEDDDVECTLIERKVLALGTNHPYLCHLFATFQTDSHLFFVMEYLNGGDLMFHIQQSGKFPEVRARFYAAEIVSGLKFLHKRGIIYRDLKLDNILLDYEGHVRIADFGMCKLQIYLDKTADTFCGTPDYMAPEIIKGLKYNQTVDWWSFGVLLYEMLIGQSPFSGCDEDELFWSICNEMPSYPRFLSQEALTILTRLLDKDAKSRLGGTECMHGDIKDQDFFNTIHWERLERRDLEAPFRPRVRHPMDTQYFDRAFTGERPRLTTVEPHVLRSMDQEPFRGFSYTNPNATDR